MAAPAPSPVPPKTNITCKFSPWLAQDRYSVGPRIIGWISLVAYVLVVGVTMLMYWRKRRRLHLLKPRLHGLVLWSSLAGFVFLGWSSLRFIVGVRVFPCDLWIWLILLAVPLNGAPLVLRVVVLYRQYCFARHVQTLTAVGSAIDDNALRRLIAMKSRLELRWSVCSGAAFVLASLTVSIPVFVTGETLSVYDWDDAADCGRGCGETRNIFFATVAFCGGIWLLLCALILRIRREGRDTYGIKHELLLVAVSWFVAVFSFCTLYFITKATNNSSSATLAVYILLIGSFAAHCITVIMPLMRAKKYEKRLKKQREQNGQSSLSGSKSAVTTSARRTSAQMMLDDDEKPPTRWQVLSGNVKPPSARQEMRDMLLLPAGYEAFETHLMREFAIQNLSFWRKATEWGEQWEVDHAEEKKSGGGSSSDHEPLNTSRFARLSGEQFFNPLFSGEARASEAKPTSSPSAGKTNAGGWVEMVEPKSGAKYLANPANGEVRWADRKIKQMPATAANSETRHTTPASKPSTRFDSDTDTDYTDSETETTEPSVPGKRSFVHAPTRRFITYETGSEDSARGTSDDVARRRGRITRTISAVSTTGAAWAIFNTYLADSAPLQITMSQPERQAVRMRLSHAENKGSTPPVDIFDVAIYRIERYMARAHFQEFKTTAEYKALEMRRGLVELAVEKVHGVVGDGYIQSALSPTATGSMLGAAPPPNGLNDGGGGGGGGRPKSSKRRSQAL